MSHSSLHLDHNGEANALCCVESLGHITHTSFEIDVFGHMEKTTSTIHRLAVHLHSGRQHARSKRYKEYEKEWPYCG